MPPLDDAHACARDDEEWLGVYRSLRKLAATHIRRSARTSLSVSTLVHEAYLRLARAPGLEFKDPDHYLHTASQAMRWILVERTREGLQKKRGGGWSRVYVELSATGPGSDEQEQAELMSLEEALRRLLEQDPREGQVVVMRALGMSVDEVSLALGVSKRTVGRDWRHGLHWLQRELAGASG